MSKSNESTEIVYLCSPNHYENLLFTSIRSLLKSGSNFDLIIVFCVGQKPKYWDILDPRIQIVEVESLREDNFLINKVYALTRTTDRLIFLDADTLVLKPIDTIYQDTGADFIGRPASRYTWQDGQNKWLQVLEKYKCRDIPYFNCGFFIFQNGSHLSLFETWRDLTEQVLNDSTTQSFHGKRFAEQIALSLTLGKSSISYKCMKKHEHTYGWESAKGKEAVVYHTGGTNYLSYFINATGLEAELGLLWVNMPQFKSYPNPIHYHRWLVFLMHRLLFANQLSWLLKKMRSLSKFG